MIPSESVVSPRDVTDKSKDVGAHISVMKKEETTDLTIKEIGDQFEFFVDGFHCVKPDGWDGVERVYFLTVKSPDLEILRKKYKLTNKIDGHEFHITVGVERSEDLGKALTDKSAPKNRVFARGNFQQRLGYKIVGYDGTRYFSLYETKTNVNVSIGSVTSYPGGLYLGSSEKFCIDYYSGGTNFQDAMLTYQYDVSDIVRGDPDIPDGEILVKKATLESVKLLENNELV